MKLHICSFKWSEWSEPKQASIFLIQGRYCTVCMKAQTRKVKNKYVLPEMEISELSLVQSLREVAQARAKINL